jgi:hypothetical protein
MHLSRTQSLCLLLLTWGCRDPDGGDSGTQADTSLPQTLQDRADCTDSASPFTQLELSETAMATVPRVAWQSESAITPTLILEPGDGRILETPGEASAGTSGEVLILGAPALVSARALLAVETEQGRLCSDLIEFETGLLSTGLPELNLSATGLEDSQTPEGFTLTELVTEDGASAIIMDGLGHYVWAHPMGDLSGARVVASLDRKSVLMLDWARGIDDAGHIHRIGLDGTEQASTEVIGIHTDFVELPDGGFGALTWEKRELIDDNGETRNILGDRLVRIHTDGTSEVLWNSFDSLPLNLDKTYNITGYGGPDLEDWSHANGLDYDPDEDAFFISIAGLDSVVRINANTGVQEWWLDAASAGDFSTADSELAVVDGPHSIESLGDDRILLFNRRLSDDGKLPADADVCSEAVELQLYPETGEVETVWSYGSEDCLWVIFYGEARRLESGNTLIIFSSAGQIDEATPDGETVWRVNTDIGGAFGFGDRIERFRLD